MERPNEHRDLDLWTWPRYLQAWPTCQNSGMFVSLARIVRRTDGRTDTHTHTHARTHTHTKNYSLHTLHPQLTQGVMKCMTITWMRLLASLTFLTSVITEQLICAFWAEIFWSLLFSITGCQFLERQQISNVRTSNGNFTHDLWCDLITEYWVL